MEAVLFSHSRMRLRVAFLKPLATALAIGTGGPFGAEGPIIQTGAAFGSLFGQAVGLTPYYRRVLLAAGAAAGMAATFTAPLAGILVAIELLLFEFRARSFIPVALAAAVATGVRIHFAGWAPLFPTPAYKLTGMNELWLFGIMGILMGIVGIAMIRALSWIEDFFDDLPFKRALIWSPAIGAAILGVDRILLSAGFRHRLRHHPRHAERSPDAGRPARRLRREILGAGHLPRLGNHRRRLCSVPDCRRRHRREPTPSPASISFRIWSAIPRSTRWRPWRRSSEALRARPFTSIVFLFELSHNPNALLPLIVCVMVADGFVRLFSRDSIMTGKLVKRGLIVLQDYSVPVLMRARIDQVMRKQFYRDAGRCRAAHHPAEFRTRKMWNCCPSWKKTDRW